MDDFFANLESIDFDFSNKMVVDYGCKTGRFVPAFIKQGVKKISGIDIYPEYIREAKEKYQSIPGCEIEFSLSRNDGLIDIQSNSIDFIFMNEVISHIHYKYLATIFLECFRILKKGGILFISDYNKINNKTYRRTFTQFYQQWENGPTGIITNRDIVTKSFLDHRLSLISKHFPNLTVEIREYLAENTSLLNEKQIIDSVNNYLSNNNFIERKYLPGICPVNPTGDGFLMERGFISESLKYQLEEFGFKVRLPIARVNYRKASLYKIFKNILITVWYFFFNKRHLIVYAQKTQ